MMHLQSSAFVAFVSESSDFSSVDGISQTYRLPGASF